MRSSRLAEEAIKFLDQADASEEADAVRRLLARDTERRGVAKLLELLLRWGAADESLLELGIGGITCCIIPPHGVPPRDDIEQRDGWQVWLVGLGYPDRAYATLDEALQAALDERALIEEVGP